MVAVALQSPSSVGYDAGVDDTIDASTARFWLPLVEWKVIPRWQKWAIDWRAGHIAAAAYQVRDSFLSDIRAKQQFGDLPTDLYSPQFIGSRRFFGMTQDYLMRLGRELNVSDIPSVTTLTWGKTATYKPLDNVVGLALPEPRELVRLAAQGSGDFSEWMNELQQVLAHEFTHYDQLRMRVRSIRREIRLAQESVGFFDEAGKSLAKYQVSGQGHLGWHHPIHNFTADAGLTRTQGMCFEHRNSSVHRLKESEASLVENLLKAMYRDDDVPFTRYQALWATDWVDLDVPEHLQNPLKVHQRFYDTRPQDKLFRSAYHMAYSRKLMAGLRSLELGGNLLCTLDVWDTYHVLRSHHESDTTKGLQLAGAAASVYASVYNTRALFGIGPRKIADLMKGAPAGTIASTLFAVKDCYTTFNDTQASFKEKALSVASVGASLVCSAASLYLMKGSSFKAHQTLGQAALFGGRLGPAVMLGSMVALIAFNYFQDQAKQDREPVMVAQR